MRRTNLLLIACTLLFTYAACTRTTPPETTNTNAPPVVAPTVNPTPAQIVRASADAVTLKAGASGAAQVRLQIADGYHINANPATFSYLKATELAVAANAGLTAGKPAYPPPVMKKFQFAPQPLAVYEHEAMIRLPLRASATKGAQNLHARVQVQACDEEKCFPPTTVETDIPVTIN
jgi:uncharacterized protein